jgi:hypothetical protein
LTQTMMCPFLLTVDLRCDNALAKLADLLGVQKGNRDDVRLDPTPAVVEASPRLGSRPRLGSEEVHKTVDLAGRCARRKVMS